MKPEQKWRALLRRDPGQDGQWVFGVITTGVFCRPSCPARRPRREHVRFFPTPAAARRAGLRPCRRCWRPLAAAKLRELCLELRRHPEDRPSLSELGQRTGLSRWHLQRAFLTAFGVTPQQYLEALRVRSLKRRLSRGTPVTAAIYDAGYGSASRVYARAATRLGMTPGQYRAGAHQITIAVAAIPASPGQLLVGMTGRGVCFACFGGSEAALRAQLAAEFPRARIVDGLTPRQQQWLRAMTQLTGGRQSLRQLPVELQGTVFQAQVWRQLRSIAPGRTQTYGAVAAALGRPQAARAVARACARNRIALAVPCHRVVNANGAAGGYRWGAERKRRLLRSEAAAQ